MRSRAIVTFLVLVFLLIVFSASKSYAKDILQDFGAAFITHFDKQIKADKPRYLNIMRTGGRIISNGIMGGCLNLNTGEYLTIDHSDIINATEGTISLWVRPHWTHSDSQSHTFLSFLWSSKKGSYGALSAGWWGAHSTTYFILDNRYPHASGTQNEIRFLKDQWVHLLCTWKAGKSGYVKLYINGYMVSQRGGFKREKMEVKGLIFIGCDKGTLLSKNRWADCDIDELAFFPRALSSAEILEMYNACGLEPYEPEKNSNGVILESRVIFDEGRGWMTEKGAVETIAKIKGAGFNVYIPCVWHGQGARYPSQIAPTEKDQVFKEDPLARIISLAHSNGIEVHPWFCVALRQRHFLTDFYDENTPEKAFDLHRPGFRNFVTALISDVVERYDVDGVNLDYIRTMGLCTCNFCLAEYKKKYGRDILEDMQGNSRKRGIESHIQDWQDNAVESIVRDIAEATKKLKPNIIISVDGHPHPSDVPPSTQGRREIAWANKKLIDVIYAMDYRESPNFELFDAVRRELNEPSKLIPLLGNYDRNFVGKGRSREARLLEILIKRAQQRKSGSSIAVYHYGRLNESQLRVLKSTVFKNKAVPSW